MTEAEVIAMHKGNERLRNLVSSLESQLAWLRKKAFGSMSDKHLPLNPDELQLNLFLEQMIDDEKAKLEAEVSLQKRRI